MTPKPVLHGDNGATQKVTTVLAMLNWLGIKPSYELLTNPDHQGVGGNLGADSSVESIGEQCTAQTSPLETLIDSQAVHANRWHGRASSLYWPEARPAAAERNSDRKGRLRYAIDLAGAIVSAAPECQLCAPVTPTNKARRGLLR